MKYFVLILMLASNNGISNIVNIGILDLFQLENSKVCCKLKIKFCCDSSEICLEEES